MTLAIALAYFGTLVLGCIGLARLYQLARSKGTRHARGFFRRHVEIGAPDEDDDIEALMEAAEREVGALVDVGADESPAARAGLRRQAREVVKRRPFGMAGTSAIPAGDTNTFTATPKRAIRINRLLVTTDAPGVVIDSFKVGDIEQLLTPGVPAELYGPDALTDSVPDNFDAIPANTEVSIELRNTTLAPISATVGAKCAVLSTGA